MNTRTLLTLAALFALNPAAQAQTYTLRDLGALTPGGTSYGLGVNFSGLVVGSGDVSSGFPHAFASSGGAPQDLGTLGGTSSQALGVNGAGQIAGWARTNGQGDHAFLYAGGTMQDLGTLGGGNSFGQGINAVGQVAGYSLVTGNGDTHAFLYSGTPGAGGAMRDLGTLGGADSHGNAVNDAGLVAGDAQTAGGQTHAFLASVGTGGVVTRTDLGTLGAGTYSAALGLNASGQAVGYSYRTASTSGTDFHAFTTVSGAGGTVTLADLGTLGGGSSIAYGVNGVGRIVGYSATVAGASHAFVFTGTPGAGGAMADLNALLDSGSGTGWTLNFATAINDGGQITGYGTNPLGNTRAFLLSPTPEPPGWAVLCLGALGLGALVRKKAGC